MKFIDYLTEEEQLEAVRKDGTNIACIIEPSEEVQLAAVKQNGGAIRFIKDPSEQVQLEAVKEYVYAIEYIHDPTIEVQNIYLKSCLKHNKDVDRKFVKDLDIEKIKNLIDCKDLIE